MLKSQVLLALKKNCRRAAFVHVDGMDVADARMVVLIVVPGEEAGEVIEIKYLRRTTVSVSKRGS